MSYYDNQESVANIYVGLVERGWKCYGYRADQSDSMTDYWSPASWQGISEKNGFVLLVDVYGTHDSGRTMTKQGYAPDWSKIEKLQATINDKASSQNEKDSSQKIIDNMMVKEHESTMIIDEYPTFSNGNPKGCNWHIEKDGNIIAKGKGAFQCDGYLFGGYKEETMLKVNKFIDKIEKHIVDNTQLEKVIVKTIKKVIKPVAVTERQTIQEGDVLSFDYHGHFWIVNSVYTQKNGKVCATYELLGSEKRGYQKLTNGKRYYDYMVTLEKNVQEGKVKVYTLQEVDEIIEKVTYKKTNRKQKVQEENLLAGEVVEEVTESPEQVETVTGNNDSLIVELIHNDEKNGLELKFNGKPSDGTRKLLKENGFKWGGKYNKVWYKKNSDSALLFAEAFVSAFNEIDITTDSENHSDILENEEINVNKETENTFIFNNEPTIEMDLQYFASDTIEKEEVKTESKGAFNMNGLLNKFASVTIENETRISEVDKAYCERQEKLYNEAAQAMQQTLELFKGIYDNYTDSEKRNYKHYIDSHEDIRHCVDRIKKFKNEFISNIVYHFEKSYNVTLNSSDIRDKYKETNVTHANIIDEVFEQLGGFDFTEKAVNEIKETSRKTVYRDDKIIINKGKLSIQDYVWWDQWDDKKRIGYSDSKITPLFKALSHFETGLTDTIDYYESIYSELRKGEREFDIFSKYELNYNKVKTFKTFKNGKVEIEFQTNEQAQQFKNEYLAN